MVPPPIKPSVWVPHRGHYDFRSAERFGELRFIVSGGINRHNPAALLDTVLEAMKDAKPQDYLLMTGPTMTNIYAAGVLARRFGRVNLLVFSPQRDAYTAHDLPIE